MMFQKQNKKLSKLSNRENKKGNCRIKGRDNMNIEDFCAKYNLGTVIDIEKLSGGLMHKMFKVKTTTATYAIKVLNREVMNREDAYNNFVVSEKISNLAKENNIPVSSAISIEGNYLTEFENIYYMVFNYVEGKTLSDKEITVEHCKKIGTVLAKIHNLDYQKLGLTEERVAYKRLYDWEGYALEVNFNKMSYREEYLKNYKKYNSILKRANERFNDANTVSTICHRDMDPKNVMWNQGVPIIIDWESATLANPYQELLETALSWSGFLTNNFSEEKFKAVFLEYQKLRNIKNIDWYDVICGNLVGRLEWLKYNLERSLGIITSDEEEKSLGEQEVSKTIEEISRYLELIGTMDDIIDGLITTEEQSFDKEIEKIIENTPFLKGKNYNKRTAGFTNTIYQVEDYIVRICTKKENEKRFEHEIDFYQNNKSTNIPKLYIADKTKELISYNYEVLEKVEGPTLYEVWYKLTEDERKGIILKLINVLQHLHSKKVEEYDFNTFIKDKIKTLIKGCNITNELFDELLSLCDIYFKENKFGQIHGDLHFDNIIYQDDRLILLDFEYSMPAAIDYDYRILNRYEKVPWRWASSKTDMLTTEEDYQDLMPIIIENDNELKEIKFLKERLSVYDIIDLLQVYKDTHKEEMLEESKKIVKELKYN